MGLFSSSIKARSLIAECMALVQATRIGGAPPQVKLKGLAGDVLRHGAELIRLGVHPRVIEAILKTKISNTDSRYVQSTENLQSLMRFFWTPSAVLVLVALSFGLHLFLAAAIGAVTSLALKLYCTKTELKLLLVARENRKTSKVALQAVFLAANGTPLIEAQTILNSYVGVEDQYQILGFFTPPEKSLSNAA
jgi:hypothetical protein